MKLRLRENSLRLRLLRSEVESLRKMGSIAETITFSPGQEIIYRIDIIDSGDSFASLEDGMIILHLSKKEATDWADSEKEGIYFRQLAGKGLSLSVSIEKDFACIQRPEDPDNLDAFENPRNPC